MYKNYLPPPIITGAKTLWSLFKPEEKGGVNGVDGLGGVTTKDWLSSSSWLMCWLLTLKLRDSVGKLVGWFPYLESLGLMPGDLSGKSGNFRGWKLRKWMIFN